MGINGAWTRDAHLISSQELTSDRLAETKELNTEISVIETATGKEAVQFAQDRLNPRQLMTTTQNRKIKDIVRVRRKDGSGDVNDNGKLKPTVIEDKAKEFARRNRELDPEILKRVMKDVKEGMSEQEIQDVITSYYPDPYLANDVYDFVIESSMGKLQDAVRGSKSQHEEQHAREIQIGQNISEQARSFEDKGLDSPTKLREWYHATVTSTPGQVKTTELFLKMLDRFGFDKLVKAVHFYLAALGADLRKRGLPGAELGDKVHQVRSFQAIIIVFRMSRMRMRVVDKALEYYAKLGTRESLPPNFDFQAMGRTLMNILQNRHIHKDTILNEVRAQGFANKEIAMSCVIQQMSLMLNDLDPNRVFTSPTHKEDVIKFFKECLEFLYANAQPEESSEWLSEEILPDGLENELIGDTAALNNEIKNMQNDPELKDFMSAFNTPVDLGDLESPRKKRQDQFHRLPVITFMGHQHHGKTALVDALCKTNFGPEELGAITQRIRSFSYDGMQCSFSVFDTPGYASYSSLRQRVSTLTDLMVLVIAGDEGIQPQTDEAIAYAKEAKIPLIVAITKCDKPNFNIENVYRQLAERNLRPGAKGGQTVTIKCSSSSGEGITQLFEMIALQAEVLDLSANAADKAYGVVVDSEIRKGTGNVATVLVKDGSLRTGDVVVFNQSWGRVGAMKDEFNEDVTLVGPSQCARITGLLTLPEPAENFMVVSSEQEAREIAENRDKNNSQSKVPLFNQAAATALGMPQGEKKVLRCLVRGLSWSSVQAMRLELLKLQSDKIDVEVVNQGVGDISEEDVQIAAACGAVIVGFNSRIEAHADNLSKSLRVIVCQFEFIYHVADRMKLVITQLPETRRVAADANRAASRRER